MSAADAARGRWREILTEFGLTDGELNGRHQPCPVTNDGTDRFRFSDHGGRGGYFCHCAQNGGDGFDLLQCKTGKGFAELAKEVEEIIGHESKPVPRKRTYADRIMEEAVKAPRSAYLESRGLEMPPGLLWSRSVEYREGGVLLGMYPAMIAPIKRGGKVLTVHVTYLENGKKADVPSARKIMPGQPIRGGAVELYPPAERMGVAEGICTSIAASMMFRMPVHAAISANGMATWEPPEIAQEVHIFGDRDANLCGHAAAYTLANRLINKGLKVFVMFPGEVGADFNDSLLRQRS